MHTRIKFAWVSTEMRLSHLQIGFKCFVIIFIAKVLPCAKRLKTFQQAAGARVEAGALVEPENHKTNYMKLPKTPSSCLLRLLPCAAAVLGLGLRIASAGYPE